MSGAELRRIRQRLGLTQTQLAEQLGTTERTVSRWEQGHVGIGESVARLTQFVASSAHKPRRAKRRRKENDHGAR